MSVLRDGEFLRDYLTITEIDQILVYLTAMFGVYELMSKKSNHIRCRRQAAMDMLLFGMDFLLCGWASWIACMNALLCSLCTALYKQYK
ncbi:hypothetical protein YC2023_045521 [Brassica napus]